MRNIQNHNVKIFTDNIETTAIEQIERLLTIPAFGGCKIRIMPDVHAGAGCVIGFTGDLGDKVIPNIVGVDIGCGIHVRRQKGSFDLLHSLFHVVLSEPSLAPQVLEYILKFFCQTVKCHSLTPAPSSTDPQ